MNQITAKVVALPTRLECSSCGASTLAPCSCHVPYVLAGTRAAQAVAEHPEMSDRAIAAQIGVGTMTVSRARKATVPDGTVEPRTGRDGKKRKVLTAKERKRKAIARIEATPPERRWVPPTPDPKVGGFLAELGKFMSGYCPRLNQWLDSEPPLDEEAVFALVQNLSEFSMWLQRLAQKIDGR